MDTIKAFVAVFVFTSLSFMAFGQAPEPVPAEMKGINIKNFYKVNPTFVSADKKTVMTLENDCIKIQSGEGVIIINTKTGAVNWKGFSGSPDKAALKFWDAVAAARRDLRKANAAAKK